MSTGKIKWRTNSKAIMLFGRGDDGGGLLRRQDDGNLVAYAPENGQRTSHWQRCGANPR